MTKIFCLAFLILNGGVSLAKEVALTIDDAPREDENIFSGTERTKKIIEILKRRHIQTVFFCNSAKLGQANGQARIQSYADAGFFIANHTHSHPSLNDIPVDDYIKEIDLADQFLKPFVTFKKLFRYPFLDEGPTPQIRDQVRAHLKEKGYRIGNVTVDNFDYVINEDVQRAIADKKPVDLDKACGMLIDNSLNGLEYQDRLAIEHFGKPVRQTLLMHENDLEAICLDRLIDRLQAKNWKIISPLEAFE